MTSLKIRSVEKPERWRLQRLGTFYRLSRLSNFLVCEYRAFFNFGFCRLEKLKQGLALRAFIMSLYDQPLLQRGLDLCFVFPTSRV